MKLHCLEGNLPSQANLAFGNSPKLFPNSSKRYTDQLQQCDMHKLHTADILLEIVTCLK